MIVPLRIRDQSVLGTFLSGEALKLSLKTRSTWYLLGLSTIYLGLNYLWASYNSLVLPSQVAVIAPATEEDVVLGIIASVGVMLGLFFNLVSGVLSDRVTLFWGRRRPFIVLGTGATILLLIAEIQLPLSVIFIALEYTFMEIFTNLSQGSFRPLLPDLVKKEQRGKAAGFLGLFTMIGTALGYGITGYELGSGHFTDSLELSAALLLLTTLPTLFVIRRDDPPVKGSVSFRQALAGIVRIREEAPKFFWFVGGTFLVYMGSSGLIYFEPYYFKAVLGLENPAYGVALTGIVVLISGILSAVAFGILSDFVGRKMMLVSAALAGGTFMLLLPFVRSMPEFLVIAALLGTVIGIFVSVRNAMASDLVPAEASGKFMGYANLSVGGPSVLAPLFDGVILSVFSGFMGGFGVLFFISGGFYFLGALLLFRVKCKGNC
ncbi:MAG: MFS transporter [Thermoprotei archaeon]